MSEQLAIPVEVVNPNGHANAKSVYDTDIKNRNLHPVFLVFNPNNNEYFVSRFFTRDYIEKAHPTFKIIE
jgi:hypothetical protein